MLVIYVCDAQKTCEFYFIHIEFKSFINQLKQPEN